VARASRSRKSFQRRQGQRQPRAVTLIVCEGQTERAYFDALRRRLRLTNAEVLFPVPAGSAPISVVDCAIGKAKESGGYDFIYCVFDCDQHESFDRALNKLHANAKRHPLHAIVSIPCFEYWILLHFENTDAPFSACDNVIDRIEEHFPGYAKSNAKQIENILDRIDDALKRAQEKFKNPSDPIENPHTSSHRLVQHLQRTAAQDSKE
jgi:hypothetical protein